MLIDLTQGSKVRREDSVPASSLISVSFFFSRTLIRPLKGKYTRILLRVMFITRLLNYNSCLVPFALGFWDRQFRSE